MKGTGLDTGINIPEEAFCPNCGRRAEREGKVITCEHCDAEFKIEPGGARPKTIGRLDDHENRLAALEAEKAGKPKPPPAEQPTDPTVTDDEEEEDDI